MYRYYYNVNSSKRVLHLYGCHYLTNSKTKEYGEKHSIEKALKKGFTLCKHCFDLKNRFFNEDKRIGMYLMRYNYLCSCEKDCIEITTGNGRWKILYAEDKPILELYHENKQIRSTDCLSRIQGYHNQKVFEYELNDILHYIYVHDGKRKIPPAKGTKRYKELQKKKAQKARRESINNVLNLIDILQIDVSVI